MKELKISFPDEVHKELKTVCVQKEIPMKHFILKIIKKELKVRR